MGLGWLNKYAIVYKVQVDGVALIMHTKGPTALTIARKSLNLVTSTLTARLDFFLSMVCNSSFAAGLVK